MNVTGMLFRKLESTENLKGDNLKWLKLDMTA